MRYLKKTKTNGLILKPENDLRVDCYVDANFGDLFSVEDKQDPVCVKSRTGYVNTYRGVPLMWVFKMQTQVALSTMEAEYIALSQSMRDLIPICEILKEIMTIVFEISPSITTKHIGIPFHWFITQVERLEIHIERINTNDQLADQQFTKGLTVDAFCQAARKSLMGW